MYIYGCGKICGPLHIYYSYTSNHQYAILFLLSTEITLSKNMSLTGTDWGGK